MIIDPAIWDLDFLIVPLLELKHVLPKRADPKDPACSPQWQAAAARLFQLSHVSTFHRMTGIERRKS